MCNIPRPSIISPHASHSHPSQVRVIVEGEQRQRSYSRGMHLRRTCNRACEKDMTVQGREVQAMPQGALVISHCCDKISDKAASEKVLLARRLRTQHPVTLWGRQQELEAAGPIASASGSREEECQYSTHILLIQSGTTVHGCCCLHVV